MTGLGSVAHADFGTEGEANVADWNLVPGSNLEAFWVPCQAQAECKQKSDLRDWA